MGTQIKMEEYFEVFSTDFTHFFELLIPAAMPIGLFLIIIEIVLGVAVLLNFKMKWTIWSLGLIIAFFTFLTFHSAYFNKVTDCGCFGDAIPLTPWQSFSKDVVLVILISYMFWRMKNFKPWLSFKTNTIIVSGATILSIYLGIHAINHLPFIDFRPYGVGDNIPANMVAPEQPVFIYTFEKEGKEIRSDKYLPAEEGYKYIKHEITNQENTIPKITDYNIWNDELGDYTSRSFVGLKILLVIYDARSANREMMPEIKKLIDGLGQEVETIVLTASLAEDMQQFLAESHLNIPFFYGDATVLKAMTRSSPGIMLLNNGTVLGKWHYNDTPDVSEIEKIIIN